MAPKKHPTAGNMTTSEDKSIATTGGIVSPSDLNLSPMAEETVSAFSQGAAGDIHSPLMYETQLQMFTDTRRWRSSMVYLIASVSKRRMIEKMRPVNERS